MYAFRSYQESQDLTDSIKSITAASNPTPQQIVSAACAVARLTLQRANELSQKAIEVLEKGEGTSEQRANTSRNINYALFYASGTMSSTLYTIDQDKNFNFPGYGPKEALIDTTDCAFRSGLDAEVILSTLRKHLEKTTT